MELPGKAIRRRRTRARRTRSRIPFLSTIERNMGGFVIIAVGIKERAKGSPNTEVFNCCGKLKRDILSKRKAFREVSPNTGLEIMKFYILWRGENHNQINVLLGLGDEINLTELVLNFTMGYSHSFSLAFLRLLQIRLTFCRQRPTLVWVYISSRRKVASSSSATVGRSSV